MGGPPSAGILHVLNPRCKLTWAVIPSESARLLADDEESAVRQPLKPTHQGVSIV
jgi:hypothetical protein